MDPRPDERPDRPLAERYWQDGYVLIPGLVSDGALSRYEQRFIEVVSAPETRTSQSMVVMRDIMVVRGAVEAASPLHAVNEILSFEDDPVLFGYALEPKQLEVVRSLIGRDLMTISTNVFNKPPGVDGRHPFHQDLRYFSLRPADKIAAAWTALSPCTRENGCLAVIPGSHRGRSASTATQTGSSSTTASSPRETSTSKPACTWRWRQAIRCSSTRCCCTEVDATARTAFAAPSRCTMRLSTANDRVVGESASR